MGECKIQPNASKEVVTALINRSHSVLIRPEIADCLGLVHHKLPVLEEVELAMAGGGKKPSYLMNVLHWESFLLTNNGHLMFVVQSSCQGSVFLFFSEVICSCLIGL